MQKNVLEGTSSKSSGKFSFFTAFKKIAEIEIINIFIYLFFQNDSRGFSNIWGHKILPWTAKVSKRYQIIKTKVFINSAMGT